jgi:hypothetical protein
MNVLKEMLATPAARKAATKPGAPPAEKGAGRGDTLGKLRGITGGKSA